MKNDVIENELKLLIPESLFLPIQREAMENGAVETLQTNHYFDTPDFSLYRSNVSLRIREKNRCFEATLKTGGAKSGLGITSREFNRVLSETEAHRALEGCNDLWHSFFDTVDAHFLRSLTNSLSHIGHMTTKRTAWQAVSRLPFLELDRNDYLGITDYEIEWEHDNREQGSLQAVWLADRNLNPVCFPSTGKFRRFIERLHAF